MITRAHIAGAALIFTAMATLAVSSVGSVSGKAVGAVTGKVTLAGPDGDPKESVSGVVVLLEDVPGSDPRQLKKRENKRITQKNRRFLPEVTVVPAGSSVDFPNEDLIDHNVFSLSRARVFDLGLYRNPESKSVTFNRPGVVDVYCNIHPDMAAKIKIVDTVHYAEVKADGSFTIPNVPPGTYPIVAWQPYGDEYRGKVTIESGKTAAVQIALREKERSQRHLNKEGKPYGRYR